MLVRIGCELTYNSAGNVPMIMLVRPREQYNYHVLLKQKRTVSPEIPLHQFANADGNLYWRILTPPGDVTISYDAIAEVSPDPDPQLIELNGQLVQDLPDEVLPYLLASRYCPSDLVIGEAWDLFGQTPPGWWRVQAICNWLKNNITYGKWSTPSTTGYETFKQGMGVCRDFAHMGVMLCRAMSIPARYVCGYLPDINVVPDPTPMDFHAWFEVYLNGAWRTFDARHNFPRYGRVFIGYGRDAVDVPLVTSYGAANLVNVRVWADEVKPEDAAALMEEF